MKQHLLHHTHPFVFTPLDIGWITLIGVAIGFVSLITTIRIRKAPWWKKHASREAPGPFKVKTWKTSLWNIRRDKEDKE